MHEPRRVLTTALALLSLVTALRAAESREVRAARTPTPPAIDGRVDEAVWALAPAVTEFEQQRPDNGQPASEPIRVHVLFDDRALYVGAVLPHRRSPMVRLLGRRDTFLDSDWFGILIDSQRDRRSALGFYVNPEGVQLDEAFSDDTVEDFNWDATWQSAATVGTDGWSAEIRVPLSLLRFVPGQKQVWGVNFIRWIRARQEQARLFSHPRNEKGFVSRFGDLVGLDGINPRSALDVQVHATAAASRNTSVPAPDPFGQQSRSDADGGFDLRWTTRSSVTLNATINPDFGQVEVDPAILNLSEFELFLPEKRPFFVEGGKLFSFGTVATTYSSPFASAHPLLFYSRRIGREPQAGALSGDFLDLPQSTRILGAARFTGRFGRGTTVSVIDAVTDSSHARAWRAGETARSRIQPRTNYFIGRATHEWSDSSRIGALLTSVFRDGGSSTPVLTDRATVAGVDGYSYFRGGDLLVDWMVAGSQVEGDPAAIRALQLAPARYYQRPDATHVEVEPSRALRGYGFRASVSRERGTWRYNAGVQSYSPGFEINDAGFHARSDQTAAQAQLTWFDVAKRRYTRNNRVTLGAYRARNGEGDVLTDGMTAQYVTTFVNWWTTSATVSYGFGGVDDRETRGGPAVARPAGWSSQVRVASNTARRVWFEVARSDGSDAHGGSVAMTQAAIGFRPRSNVMAQLTAVHATNVVASKFFTSVVAPNALFGRRTILGRLTERRLEIAPRLDWTLRRTLSLQVYLQPLAASGSYDRIGELRQSGGRVVPYPSIAADGRSWVIDPGGDGARFSVVNPDFTFRSFRGNAVLRWEVGPATLYAVWNEGRQLRLLQDADGRMDGLRSVRDLPRDDRFLLKVSYRFELPR